LSLAAQLETSDQHAAVFNRCEALLQKTSYCIHGQYLVHFIGPYSIVHVLGKALYPGTIFKNFLAD